jgi:hypothetical protein
MARILLAWLLLSLAPVWAAPCDLPPEMLDNIALPRARAAILAGELRILVGGSATAESGGASPPYHARIAELLQQARPGLRVTVEARGQRGATAPESLALILAAIPGFLPHLVLWQTGTVEAVRSLEVDDFNAALSEGITQIRGAGADVALLDQQFSRFLRANADIERYRDAMRLIAAAEGVALLRRYDWMHHWAENGGPDVERAARPERAAALALLNDCLARAIVAQLRHSARLARP